ncbi:hypothetical protein F511_36077 [Dorcoceras hygrometricum]|uniref:Uncharacterized protein n=1 Tax=Dorcoceras hygrometricum TaxID=472368 RepID=A0A2Z7BI42_9LAMI|nr:hypothetical protein F511_36077 [Dorcoceras hygrometricum]
MPPRPRHCRPPRRRSRRRRTCSDRSDDEIPSVKSSSCFLVQIDEGIGIPVVDRIRRLTQPTVEVPISSCIDRSRVQFLNLPLCPGSGIRIRIRRCANSGIGALARICHTLFVSVLHQISDFQKKKKNSNDAAAPLPSTPPRARRARRAQLPRKIRARPARTLPQGLRAYRAHPAHIVHGSARHRRPTCANWSRRWPPPCAHVAHGGAHSVQHG